MDLSDNVFSAVLIIIMVIMWNSFAPELKMLVHLSFLCTTRFCSGSYVVCPAHTYCGHCGQIIQEGCFYSGCGAGPSMCYYHLREGCNSYALMFIFFYCAFIPWSYVFSVLPLPSGTALPLPCILTCLSFFASALGPASPCTPVNTMLIIQFS